MPQPAETKPEAVNHPPSETSSQPVETTPKPGTRGALFRALVGAGADATVAYNAEGEAQSMVSEAVGAQVQPILVEMRRLFADQSRQIAANGRQVAENGRQIAENGRQIAELTVAVTRHDEKLDALKRELRLIWGALGVLVTLLTVVFGFLFRG